MVCRIEGGGTPSNFQKFQKIWEQNSQRQLKNQMMKGIMNDNMMKLSSGAIWQNLQSSDLTEKEHEAEMEKTMKETEEKVQKELEEQKKADQKEKIKDSFNPQV